MQQLAALAAVRGGLSEAINKARYAGTRTILTYRGRPAAAVVPIEDLAQLERMQADETPRDSKKE